MCMFVAIRSCLGDSGVFRKAFKKMLYICILKCFNFLYHFNSENMFYINIVVNKKKKEILLPAENYVIVTKNTSLYNYIFKSNFVDYIFIAYRYNYYFFFCF